jgi:hypothetical protein
MIAISDPGMKTLPRQQVEKYLTLYRKRLGKLKSAGQFSAADSKYMANTSGGYTLIKARSNAAFEKGPADVEITVVKRGGKWLLYRMDIFSDLLIAE